MDAHQNSYRMGYSDHASAVSRPAGSHRVPGGHQPNIQGETLAERARRDHERMIEWARIVQFWGMDMADPDSPFGRLAEKVNRAQFRLQLKVEREARGDKAIMQWWEQLKAGQERRIGQ